MPHYPSNIVLTGFSGTGKTTTGRRIAEVLGWRFVDLDDIIVRRAGKSIADIFVQEGEPAFRALEAAGCQELAEPKGLVVATGGGAVISPSNRDALAAGGILVCLNATIDTILHRLALHSDRPMLSGEDRRARIAGLLAQRADAYATIPHQVDTDGLTIPAVAERVLAIVAQLPDGGHVIRVTIGGAAPSERDGAPCGDETPALAPRTRAGYDVLIAPGLLGQAGQRMGAVGLRDGRCAVISNPDVAACHVPVLLDSLRAAGMDPVLIEAPEGEAHKTLETAAWLYGQLAAIRLARNECIVALGGGVTGDMAGFVAATWLRGMPFVQIPTSLLAMVDASVGGKVAVDLPEGKNLVGAFKQPELVIVDPALLATLPPVEFRCGLAEIIKAGVIGDGALFERLERDGLPPDDAAAVTAAIVDAVRVKAHVVMRDPYEAGERAWLNLGHTFGHALELVSGFTLRHGEAVGLGMVAAAHLSVRLGHCEAAVARRIHDTVARCGLPTRCAFDATEALRAMGTDKKRRGRSLRFVTIERIGRVGLTGDVADEDVLAALESIRE